MSSRDLRLVSNREINFNKIKVGRDTLQNDVAAILDFYKKAQPRISRDTVDRAIDNNDVNTLREISNFYFKKSGIYSRLCRYMAFLYKYDWVIIPHIYDEKIKQANIVEGWYKASAFLERCYLKKTFGEIALKVIKNGCYYGYKMPQKTACFLQELPVDYCRSRFVLNGKPAIEFNIKYFNDAFTDANYRLRVLKMFPKEFQKAYIAFQNGNLPRDFQGDDTGWFLLDTDNAVKFNLNNSDTPLFASVIPAIMDLEDAKELDKQKTAQQLLKIIIQKMPVDKNGDLVFDLSEAQTLHDNAVRMLGKGIGVNVLTTFADTDVADMSDRGNVSSIDQLDKVERSLYNEAGVSQMQFNTDGNLALEKSIANDEATMTDLILQFEQYIAGLLDSTFNRNPRRLEYVPRILPTTIYNYRDLSKAYKEQTMIGFSKLLPQVALGQSQSSIIAMAYFENDIMDLDSLFIAPQLSSTRSDKEDDKKTPQAVKSPNLGDVGGRPELDDDKKSEKTIQNKESGG